jgi:hypothetical protein
LSDAYEVNSLVRVSTFSNIDEILTDPQTKNQEVKYHGFFLESACFTLAFDMMHNRHTAEKHLPWIKSGLRCLAVMLPSKNQLETQLPATMAAIQQMLQSVFPDLGSSITIPDDAGGANSVSTSNNTDFLLNHRNINLDPRSSQKWQQQQDTLYQDHFPQSGGPGSSSTTTQDPTSFFTSLGQNLMGTTPTTTTSSGTNNNQDDPPLVDFTPADLGWMNFDFSTMDLEAFLSIDPLRDVEYATH